MAEQNKEAITNCMETEECPSLPEIQPAPPERSFSYLYVQSIRRKPRPEEMIPRYMDNESPCRTDAWGEEKWVNFSTSRINFEDCMEVYFLLSNTMLSPEDLHDIIRTIPTTCIERIDICEKRNAIFAMLIWSSDVHRITKHLREILTVYPAPFPHPKAVEPEVKTEPETAS